ncbi:sugar O-acetyltransferase [Ligilactobacillus saerimneri]|uniref:Acetyltransferase n=1 Tax=Ligilactobacillus saerimneri 30a TaxID=1227363 RepID=M5J734_9LACO|nr:sugar O-acetyltransferase [Ligilactobacillus saerimneri]EKW99267.1 acetyltransferase [Ligilactobacillus saerimneri 30a]MDY4003862.1 sugar O-acetyltransferase [Ligilactobacillus saerimneri]
MEENTQNMLAGKPYTPATDEIHAISRRSHRLCHDFNQLYDTDREQRNAIVDQLLGKHGQNVYFQGPIYFDYGQFTTIGDYFYANTNLTVLDTCPVTIGNNVMLGPNVSLLTPQHPLLPEQRNVREWQGKMLDYEYGAPITIEDNCWLGGNVTVLGGVTIGAGSVVGAGAVVTKSVPPNSLVLGVPARVVRTITEADRLADWPY